MTTTPNLALVQPSSSDDYQLSVWTGNQSLIDASPGVYLAANAAAAATKDAGWGSGQNGMLVFEQDTQTYWQWNGSALIRPFPMGRLNETSVGAGVQVTGSIGSQQTLISMSVVVPPNGGNRYIRMHAHFDQITTLVRTGTPTSVAMNMYYGSGPTLVDSAAVDLYAPVTDAAEWNAPGFHWMAPDVQISAGTYTFKITAYNGGGTATYFGAVRLYVDEV